MREIILIGNPILRKKSQPVKKVDKYIERLVDEMKKILLKSEIPAVGLSAPQIGELLRVIIYREEDKIHTIINPKILKKEGKIVIEEGCLSIPGVYGDVERANKILVSGISLTGKKIEIEKEGLPAVIIQHEIDHLDGILFIDRVKDIKTLRVEEGYKIPEELLNKV
ncbi:MAG: peptide deformylase [Caldisericia bacterium]|nr:peptide deformylase [Caldisericia bacterium]